MGRLFDFGFYNNELWRSEEMQLVQLMIPSESAHDTIAALGEVGLLQFKDLNSEKSAFQRTYANQVKRCDELARKLRFLTEQVDKAGMPIAQRLLDKTLTVDELESKLEDLEREVMEVNSNNERLQRSYSELVELQMLLEKAGQFFDNARQDAASRSLEAASVAPTPSQDFGAPLLGDRETGLGGTSAFDPKVSKLGFVAGLIHREKMIPFERLLFRATRGNMFLRQLAVGKVRDPASGELQEKHVFVVFFAGERARTKIMKICEAFGANRYPFPDDVPRQRSMHAEVTSRLRELHTTIEAGEMHRHNVLKGVAANLDCWTTLVRREKAIYHTLNKLSVDTSHRVLVAEAWCPAVARARVHEALRQAADQSHVQGVGTVMQPVMSHDAPPTYYKTNKFTEVFQTIVDAYGVARYREVNPAVWTIMTFPFLFAVMFGDLGHGLLLLLFALALVGNEKSLGRQQLSDMVSMMFGGRYCILLMALFSLFTGFIYNEFFSMPMQAFGDTKWTCYVNGVPDSSIDVRDCGHTTGGELMFDSAQGAYPLGVDPIWHGTKTELPFLNSMKMKMSILLGVVHMNLGILMSLYNNNYNRDTLSTLCEFVPQVIFLNALFGYLCILIVYKWVAGKTTDLYHVMIYMFLQPGTVDDVMFPGMASLQVFLLLVSLVAVPWMLLPKPLILKKRHERSLRESHVDRYGSLADEESSRLHSGPRSDAVPAPAPHGGGHGGHGHGDHFDFGEVMVHQMIHTIEFVLGAVSNTASYLRLWALSLAHSQLSAVFYDRVLMMTISMNSPAAMVVGFFVFACATLGVLMVMESLSAFLHALRLHWVEFQNKFYKGDGFKFAPFSLTHAEQEQD